MRRRLLFTGKMLPGFCVFCGPTIFVEEGPWLRDEYRCRRCGSIPRERALIRALNQVAPNWADLTVFEASPAGSASRLLAQRCPAYIASHFYADLAPGAVRDGVRCEDLRALTLPDNSVDVVVSADVFEHVVNPALAFREIARVVRPGGVHVFTVPIYDRAATVVRVADDGRQLIAPDYHGNPIGDGRSLVVREWGADIVAYIESNAGTPTERLGLTSRWRGIRGEMADALVSRVPTAKAPAEFWTLRRAV